MGSRWQKSTAPRGADYDARWSTLAAARRIIHGEADLVAGLLTESAGRSVLDAACGTGRVAIELDRRGVPVVGFSLRPDRLSLDHYDRLAAQASLQPVQRWATWDRQPFADGDYAVSVHRLDASPT
ncbi:class I SAM-dependent methyltransferase [Mycolicibacterium sp. CBM1]